MAPGRSFLIVQRNIAALEAAQQGSRSSQSSRVLIDIKKEEYPQRARKIALPFTSL
jgi:hypothetical protein